CVMTLVFLSIRMDIFKSPGEGQKALWLEPDTLIRDCNPPGMAPDGWLSSSQAGIQRLARVQQFLNRIDRDLQARLVVGIEFDLDDLFDAAGTDQHRNADVQTIEAVLAIDIGGAGQDALLVTQISFGHRDARSCRGIKCRAGAEQRDDFATTTAGALDDRVDLFLARQAHL